MSKKLLDYNSTLKLTITELKWLESALLVRLRVLRRRLSEVKSAGYDVESDLYCLIKLDIDNQENMLSKIQAKIGR